MNMTVSRSCKPLKRLAEKFIAADKGLSSIANGFDLSIGPASESAFQTPAHAQDAIFVGDSARIIGANKTAEVDALFQADPSKVMARPVYDSDKKAWLLDFQKAFTGDALNPLAGQLFSPWNISFFKRIFREPLLYSHARELVSIEQGSNPWAEVMTLLMEQYAGFAMLNQTGSTQNSMTNDVNVINGMMSSPVLNMSVTYSLTIEEQNRSRNPNGNPFAGQGIMQKQKYANYVLDMLENYLIYFGNSETETKGLLDINPVISWTGSTLAQVASGASTTKGSDVYRMVYGLINNFLSDADNKFSKVKVAMAPEAYNYFTSLPYSDNFDPTAAWKIFNENYGGGKGENGQLPKIEFVSDPMLKANSMFNSNSFDYMVMTAPEVGAGPDNENQPLVLFGSPLREFVFPAIPGQYNTQFKTLRRVAGIFAPVPQAIRAYAGFGRA